jgi:benzoylformate decarboxylase
MPTVREATFDLFRKHGMTTIFGNPGSTELPMLQDFPEDFEYVLALQEAAAVGMADGYAQVTGRPSLVNLHTAPGLGNAIGAIFNAQANHSPVVVTVGQQVRAQIAVQANLTNRDATRVTDPYVKFAFEPARAEDVPLAIAHAIHLADLPPKGPVMVSIPMDDWDFEIGETEARLIIERDVTGRASPDPIQVERLAARIAEAENPVMVAGPDIDASGAWDEAIRLAEQQGFPVWASPAPGGGRIGFPENHPAFRGILPPAIGPIGEVLAGHDLILVVGSSVFPYYPYMPGKFIPEGAELVAITSDPDEAARAPMGDALVADVKLSLTDLLDLLSPADREPPEPLPPPVNPEQTDPLNPSMVHSLLRELLPEDAITVLEAPSATLSFRSQMRISKPSSYFFGAGGGLGFGLAAAVGIQIAEPDRPVVCVIGEGSVQYAVTAFWTAASYGVPVTFLVLRNEEYAILKWFEEIEQLSGAPGLDLPALETAAIASGYGVESTVAATMDELEQALGDALADRAEGPRLIEVPIGKGIALF